MGETLTRAQKKITEKIMELGDINRAVKVVGSTRAFYLKSYRSSKLFRETVADSLKSYRNLADQNMPSDVI